MDDTASAKSKPVIIPADRSLPLIVRHRSPFLAMAAHPCLAFSIIPRPRRKLGVGRPSTGSHGSSGRSNTTPAPVGQAWPPTDRTAGRRGCSSRAGVWSTDLTSLAARAGPGGAPRLDRYARLRRLRGEPPGDRQPRGCCSAGSCAGSRAPGDGARDRARHRFEARTSPRSGAGREDGGAGWAVAQLGR